MKVTLTKKKPGQQAKCPPCPKGAAPVAFNLQDNGDLTYTVFGVDAAGAQLDITGVATLTAVSDAPAVVVADSPVGMTGAVHAATPAPSVGASANVSLTATWNDGSVGPFTIVWPFSISSGGPTGITVVPGTPTVH